jgi:hypothetical protein
MLPGGNPTSAGNAKNGASTPTQEPPAALVAAKSDCGCNKGASTVGAGSVPASTLESASMSGPSMLPDAVGASGVAAAWRSNVHVTSLWSINQDRNCWAYFDNGIGWRRLSATSESGLVSLNMVAANAYQMGTIASAYEENDGSISQMYVW